MSRFPEKAAVRPSSATPADGKSRHLNSRYGVFLNWVSGLGQNESRHSSRHVGYVGEGVGTRAEASAHPIRSADHHSPLRYNPGSFMMPCYRPASGGCR